MAQGTHVSFDDVSLEDLMQVEVTSVSKKPQRMAHVAAAIHVIGADDIRDSGANSLPEVLRLAPGIDASPISGNRWGISARGFAEQYAPKMLVLVDGRNAFNPAFSGMSWEDLLFPLEDIERIEVIRGSAAAVWGTNGMNGVINIITKSSAATQGGLLVAGAGNLQGGYGRVRWGGQNTDHQLFYRAYASTQRARQQQDFAGASADNGHESFGHDAAGFRLDHYLRNGARLDVSGDFYSNRSDGQAFMVRPAGIALEQQREEHRGVHLRARYDQPLGDGGNLQLQMAYVHSLLDIPYVLKDERDTLDLDVQHRFQHGQNHDIVWGVNYRLSDDSIAATPMMQVRHPARRLSNLGLFAQDEIRLADTLRLTLGLRMDHNELSGWDSQPTGRLSWNLAPMHTLWGSLSQAARAPSRVDPDFVLNYRYIPGHLAGFVPDTLVIMRGMTELKSEKMRSAEIGWRSQWASTLSTDIVVYTHRYRDMLRADGTETITPGFPLTTVYVDVGNSGGMTLNGLELAADWRIASDWRANLAQTWQSPRHDDTAAIDPYFGAIPDSITSLRLSWRPAGRFSANAWLRRTTARPASATTAFLQRSAATEFDLHLAWQLQKGVELSLHGQNLTDGSCDAFDGVTSATTINGLVYTCRPRSIFGQLKVEF